MVPTHVYVRVPKLGPERLNALWTEAWSMPSENVTLMSWFTGTPVCPGVGSRTVTDGYVLSIAKSFPEASHPMSAVVSRAHTRTRAVLVSIVGTFHVYEFGFAVPGRPLTMRFAQVTPLSVEYVMFTTRAAFGS